MFLSTTIGRARLCRRIAILAGAAWPLWLGAGLEAATNLVANPGMEQGPSTGPIPSWHPVTLGAPAAFHLDTQSPHEGERSIRIEAGEITRSYLESDPLAVSPGETLRIGAWVTSRDVPADRGTIILIAAFGGGDREPDELRKVAVADRQAAWQYIEGRVAVPAQATALRVRMGLSYSMGTVWWDDVSVCAEDPVSARVELPDQRLYPDTRTIPVDVLNREGSKNTAVVRVWLDQMPFEQQVTLTGAKQQRAAVPIRIESRGKRELRVELLDSQQRKPLFTSEKTVVTIPPPLVFQPPIPTHWVAEDGEPRFEGRVECALENQGQEMPRIEVRVLDQTGTERSAWTRRMTASESSGQVDFDMRAPDLPVGSYRLVCDIKRENREIARAEQTWHVIRRSSARTTVNKVGFLERNGTALFPLGMFNNPGRMEESAQAGFNIVHFYNTARVQPGRRPDDLRLQEAMNNVSRCGMHCLLMVPLKYAFAGDWDAFTRRIRMFRNHPALLAWDEEEGIARGEMTMETLATMRRILREEDPHHPLMVGDSRDVIDRVTDRSRFFPTEYMDLGMWWWYPFPLGQAQADTLQGEEAGSGAVLPLPTFLTQRITDKPIWVGVQSYKKPRTDGRYPTPEEYRSQAYLAVIHGAKGLMWYGASVSGGLFLSPDEGHWEELKGLVAELRELSPVFMAPSVDPPRILPAEVPISVMMKHTPGQRFLLSANRSLMAQDVTFMLPGAPRGNISVRNEHRTVSVHDERMQDRFEPLAVHIYELPVNSQSSP